MRMGRRCFNPRRSLALLLSSAGVCAALTGIPTVALAEGVEPPQNGVATQRGDATGEAAGEQRITPAPSTEVMLTVVEDPAGQLSPSSVTPQTTPSADAPSVPGGSTPTGDDTTKVDVIKDDTTKDDVVADDIVTDEAGSSLTDGLQGGEAEVEKNDNALVSDDDSTGDDSDLLTEDETLADGVTPAADAEEPANSTDLGEATSPEEQAKAEEEGDAEEEPAAPVIEDGTYLIQSSLSSQVLDTAGNSTSSTANVQTDNASMSDSQKWQITYDSKTGYYTVGIAGTNMVLDVAGAQAQAGANVWIYESNHSDAQLWKIVEQGGGYVLVSKLNPNLVLDLAAGGTTPGTNAQIWTSNGSGAQRFQFLSTIVDVPSGDVVEEGTYIIVAGSEDGGFSVGVSAGNLSDGGNVQLVNKGNSSGQRLTLKSDGEGYYTIVVNSSNMALEAEGGSIVPGTNVEQSAVDGSDAQKWALHRNADGSLSLQNKASGLFLDVAYGLFSSGSNVQTYTGNGTASQKFWFLPATTAADDDGIIIEDGVYLIQTAGGVTQVLDVAAGSTANGANVQIYGSNMSSAQRWRITRYNGTQYYTIALDGTSKVLDVAAGGMSDGTNVQIYEFNGSAAQLWKFVKSGGSYLIVSGLRSDLVLNLSGGSVSNGTNVNVSSVNDSQGQLFNLLSFNPQVEAGVRGEDGSYVLVVGSSQNGGYAIDVAAGSLSNGANVQIYEKNGSSAQKFYLHDDGTGFYTITVIGTGKVLDVETGNLVPGTNVRQWEANGSDAQKWALRQNSDGSFSLINKANGLALDVAAGILNNGSNLQVYTYNGSAAQKFWLTPTTILDDGIYSIRSAEDTNKAIDMEGGSSASGTKAQIWANSDVLAQRFQVVYDVTTGTYRIRTASSGGWLTESGGSIVQQGSSKTEADASNSWKAVWNGAFFSLMNQLSGKVISLGAAGVSNGADLVTSAANGSKSQHFIFLSAALVSEGLYEIHSGAQSGTSLDIVGASNEAGAGVQIYKDNNSSAQKFYIVVSGNGYAIKNLKSGKVIDVVAASTANGAAVQQWDINGSPAQLWDIQIADGGGLVFVNLNSGKALNVASNNSVNQANLDLSAASQRWTLEVTQGYGWIDQDGTWYFYYSDGTSQAFTDAAYSAYQSIKDWTSETSYLICIDNTNCRTVIFQGSAGNWEPIKDWICSVGTTNPHDPTFGITARGVFKVLGKGEVMGNDPDYYYWTEFFIPSGSPDGEGQRFHSTGYYRGTGFPGVQYDTTIGRPETHGCVRLWFDEAKWIYDYIPLGTKVYSY